MRILIVSAWYAPLQNPRAHRWTAIANYWADNGYEVHVLTAHTGHKSEPPDKVQIHHVGHASWTTLLHDSPQEGRLNDSRSLKSRFLKWIHRHIWRSIHFPDEACIWYFLARGRLKALLNTASFDVLITVSMPFTGHFLGLWAKKHFPNLYWMADNGDPAVHDGFPKTYQFLYTGLLRKIESNILRKADQFVVTHERLKARYIEQYHQESKTANIRVIPPLLFPMPALNHDLPKANGVLKIGFAGTWFDKVRTPHALANLVHQTTQLSPEWKHKLEIHLWGDIEPHFRALLSNPCFRLHGLCSRADTRAGMAAMDALINVGNTTDYQLPSKATEYLALRKPIINLSYTKHDAFEYFFRETNILISLSVAANGEITEESLQRWHYWLSHPFPSWVEETWLELVQKSSIEAIANAYLEKIDNI